MHTPTLPACFALLLMLLLLPRPASACTCGGPGTPLDALTDADVVFAGTVVDIAAVNGVYENDVEAYFEVSRAWKGIEENTVAVQTGSVRNCGYPFEQGRRYLVYAYAHEGALSTSGCGRTNRLEQAHEDLRALGIGVALRDDSGLCGGPSPMVALQTFLLVVAGALFLRRSRYA